MAFSMFGLLIFGMLVLVHGGKPASKNPENNTTVFLAQYHIEKHIEGPVEGKPSRDRTLEYLAATSANLT